MTTMPLSILERMLSDIKLAEITQENIEKNKKAMEEEKECNTNGENTLTQNQTTGKKSKKSTKKTTNTKK